MPKSVPGRISDFWGQLKKHDLKVRLQPEEHPLAAFCRLPMSGVESSVGCGSDTWRLCSLAWWMRSDCSNDRRPWTQFFPTHTTLANSATLEHPWADTDRHRWVRASCPFSPFFASSVSGFPAQPAPSRNVKGPDLPSPHCTVTRLRMETHPLLCRTTPFTAGDPSRCLPVLSAATLSSGLGLAHREASWALGFPPTFQKFLEVAKE